MLSVKVKESVQDEGFPLPPVAGIVLSAYRTAKARILM